MGGSIAWQAKFVRRGLTRARLQRSSYLIVWGSGRGSKELEAVALCLSDVLAACRLLTIQIALRLLRIIRDILNLSNQQSVIGFSQSRSTVPVSQLRVPGMT